WRIEGREGDEVKLHGVRINLARSSHDLEKRLAGTARLVKFAVHRLTFLVLFVQCDGVVSRELVDSVLPPGLRVHHIERVEETPLNSSGKTDVPALLRLFDGRGANDAKRLREELERLGLVAPFNEDLTLAELGLDSAAMLRLAFALDNEVCTKLILAGDVKLRQLMEVANGGGEGPSEPGKIRWPEVLTINLDEEDQRSVDTPSQLWSQPMEKCVDAAPLIINKSRNGNYRVVIGSHSGLIVCVEVKRGKASLRWTNRVSHRVESAAVEVGDEGIVAVCSYDGQVHCFRGDDGEQWWRHSCRGANVRGGMVAVGDCIYVADYDGSLHKLNAMKCARVWRTQIGGASMKAPPAVCDRLVAIVTLRGATYVMDTEKGGILWRDEGVGRPIFAPALFLKCESPPNLRLLTVNVDGRMQMRNAETGEEIHTISIDERVFTRPLQVDSNIIVITAAESGGSSSLLVLSESLEPLRRFNFESSAPVSIYHSPILIDQSIVITSSCGLLITVPITSLTSGESTVAGGSKVKFTMTRLFPSGGSPLFSPPVFVSSNEIVLGTRDDSVVAFRL
ncbi:hypothetical protein PFISCL1PPCAC_12090, partial [Pristionchus fissidentatus]